MRFHPFRFHGKAFEFFGIWIVNLLLTILTLGIYSAWAKVRTNRYVYGNLELDEERFEYLAKPIQILIGRLIAVTLLAVWVMSSTFSPSISVLVGLLGILLFPALIVRGLKFNLQMTRYRNVRFEFVGGLDGGYKYFLFKPIAAQVALFFPFFILIFLLLPGGEQVVLEDGQTSSGLSGWGMFVLFAYLLVGGIFAYAWVLKGINTFVVENTRFGDLRFETAIETPVYARILFFSGLWSLLAMILFGFAAFGIAFLLFEGFDPSVFVDPESQQFDISAFYSEAGVAIVLLYLGFIVFSMISQAYFVSRSRDYLFGKSALIGESVELFPSSRLSARALWWVQASNLIMIIATFGLAYPWAKMRKIRLLANSTTIEGAMALSDVTDRVKDRENALGEEAGEAFDFDVGVI